MSSTGQLLNNIHLLLVVAQNLLKQIIAFYFCGVREEREERVKSIYIHVLIGSCVYVN